MKLFSAAQIREADKYTIEHEPVASVDLMERAAAACVNWITKHVDKNKTILVFCGHGNNGGDGLAIARLLKQENYSVKIILVQPLENASPDFCINFERIKNNLPVLFCNDIASVEKELSGLSHYIVIDAILGTGINRPAEGFLKSLIGLINQLPAKRVAIDLPSGLYCDELNASGDSIIQADHTLTFQFPKFSFMYPENATYVGVFTVLDIGLHEAYIQQTATKNYFTRVEDVRLMIHHRSLAAHKGTFGHALLVAGSYGKIGAAELASKACMRSGVGLLTVHIPKCGYEIMQTAVPEVMVEPDSELNFITDAIKLEKYNSIGIGPGIGTEHQTQNVLKLMIQNALEALIFDADAINILSENKTWLSFIPANSIFTPHVKEFERLVGKCKDSAERMQKQKEFSFRFGVYVVLKGAHTAISSPDGSMYFNSSGNPGMATAGSGDVLTGIITSFKAQGYPSLIACILGVYVHGLAGDLAADKKTQDAMIASDIIENLPEAFKFIRTV